MYGFLSKTEQSLALKLMAIHTLKSNILVYLSDLNYLVVFVSDIAIFVLKRDVKLQLTNLVVLSRFKESNRYTS